MKRYIFAVAAVLMAFATTAGAQVKFGLTAGMNFNSAKIADVKMDAKAGWNVGGTILVDLPLGFSFQPSLVYMQKAAGVEVLKASVVQTVGSVVLPVSVQWGPDLIVARPFLDVTPYVGYSIANKVKGEFAGHENTVKGGNGLDYGLGLGAGLNVWKLQAVVRYNWNFGVLGNFKDFTGVDLGVANTENENFGGITFSLAYFF